MEVFSWIYRDTKNGKNRSKKGMIGYVLLYMFIFAALGVVFLNIAVSLCEPLAAVGLGWLYMALMGLMSVALGVFGSVFNTYASIYQAKDNDLLLSMPIPSSVILLVRLMGVYLMGVMYEAIVMIPAVIVFLLYGKPNTVGVIFTLLIPLVLSVFILALSCVLGFFVAVVSSKIRRKNVITVALSLIFIAAYYYVYARAYAILQGILANPAALGDKVKSILYPFYQMGLAAEGNIFAMVIFVGIMAVAFAVVYLVLSRSFLKIATANKGTAKVRYKEKTMKAKSVKQALLTKELRRFLGSSTYMLNCGLGIVLMVIAAAAFVIKGSEVSRLISMMFGEEKDLVALLAVAAVCTMTSMNDISAPSVSLEGKNIWLAHSLPVKPWDVLMAKLKLHLYLTIIPALLVCVAVLWVIRPEWYYMLLIPAAVISFVLMMGTTGLWLNLKIPNLNWTNEAVPVKQGMSVGIALFGSWAVLLVLGGIYVALAKYITPVWYLVLAMFLLLGVSGILLRWIAKKGTEIFETL